MIRWLKGTDQRFAVFAAAASGIAALLTFAIVAAGTAAAADRSQIVGFDGYTPLASNAALIERLLSPLTAARLHRSNAVGTGVTDQAVDLAAERFRVAVPSTMPSAGYGVLVFIPPWEDDHIPPGWSSVLAARGMIWAPTSTRRSALIQREESIRRGESGFGM